MKYHITQKHHAIFRRPQNSLAPSAATVAAFMLAAAMMLIALLGTSQAQQLGNVITYEDSITYDEEEDRLFFPSFTYADRYRDEIYLVDSKSRVIVYTSDLFPLYTISKKEGIVSPQGLTVDQKGYLYVSQTSTPDNPNHRISVYKPCLVWERDIILKGFDEAGSFIPYRIAVDRSGAVYAVSGYSAGAFVFDQKGRLVDTIAPEENGKKVKFNYVSIDSSGKIYLVSEEDGRIYVYDEGRKLLFKFGEKGGSTGKLSRPKAVGKDERTGRMYVVDYMRHTILVYDAEGTYIFEFGGLGWGEGWFQYPTDIVVDSKGRIFIADLFNQRVQVLHSW